MSNSQIYILVYITLWLVTFIWYQRKQRKFDVGSYLIFSYLIFAVSSLFLYNNSLVRIGEWGELTLFPLIYLFALMLVGILPVLKYCTAQITTIQQPDNLILNTLTYLFVVVSIIKAPEMFLNIRDGITAIMLDPSGGKELYNLAHQQDQNQYSLFARLTSIIYNTLSYIGMFLFYYNLTLKDRSKILTSLLLLSIILLILKPISEGLRTGTLMVVLTMIGGYFIMKPFIPETTKRLFIIFGVGILGVVAFIFLALTISRFGDSVDGTNSWLSYYLGQSPLYFDKYALDANGIRYGDRTAYIFKKMLLMDVPDGVMARRTVYSNMAIGDEVFTTYVGDFALDFGPYITPLIFLFFSLFASSRIRVFNNTISFHTLLLVFFCMTVTAQGGMYLYNYADKGNYGVMMFAIVYFIFKNTKRPHNEIG